MKKLMQNLILLGPRAGQARGVTGGEGARVSEGEGAATLRPYGHKPLRPYGHTTICLYARTKNTDGDGTSMCGGGFMEHGAARGWTWG